MRSGVCRGEGLVTIFGVDGADGGRPVSLGSCIGGGQKMECGYGDFSKAPTNL